VKRGSRYSGIILDPPAYGRGPDGEKWVLEESINELASLCAELLEPVNSFFILNLYSMGFSALVAENLANSYFPNPKSKQYGELFFPDRSGNRLPLGIFLRFTR
jgi:23S rRNA (cytosine1962-C5)-methyltransferase